MLNVVKPRALASAFALALSIGASQVINAGEASWLDTVVVPATNRADTGIVSETDVVPLAIALADPNAADANSKDGHRAAPSNKRSSWQTPARFFTINQVLAKHENVPSPLELASIRPTDTRDWSMTHVPPTQGEEPFGLFTFRAPDGLVSVKWRKLQADLDAEAPALERCRVQHEGCTPGAARFVAIIKDAAPLPLRAKLRLVNERINSAIRYTEDWAQWHQADVWSPPLDVAHKGSFDTGMGDCEDYAIAKYVALRQAGVAEADLRVLLVKDQAVHLDHAVLAVRDTGHWVILDNRWSRLTEDNELRQFVPLFALNQDGSKMFAAPYAAQSMPSIPALSVAKPLRYLDAGLAFSMRGRLGAPESESFVF